MTIPGIPAARAGIFIPPADIEDRINPAERVISSSLPGYPG
ncbi:MAG TPA: hypothetical protein PL090_07350 [Syntrophales bacterium]|nr:hypothetical protein [Syntrophales bacterium]HOP36125.1 hypothetical protein [Syntrophales bacterium]